MKTYDVNIAACSRCKGACCKKIPGICTPSDIQILFPAPTLKQSVILALESGNFSIDSYEDDYPLYYVRPATIEGKGKRFDYSWGGICVFLTSTGCQLGDKKPFNCKMLQPSAKGCSTNSKFSSKQVFGRLWRRSLHLESISGI